MLSVSPVLIASGAIMGKIIAQSSGEGSFVEQGIAVSVTGQGFYADAGQVVDEALTLIRVVMSFGTYEREIKRLVNDVL
jgi:hypothetical protein